MEQRVQAEEQSHLLCKAGRGWQPARCKAHGTSCSATSWLGFAGEVNESERHWQPPPGSTWPARPPPSQTGCLSSPTQGPLICVPSPSPLQEGRAAQVTAGLLLSSGLPQLGGSMAGVPLVCPKHPESHSFTRPSTRPVPRAGCRPRKASPMRCREQESHALSPRETRTNPSALAEPTQTRAQPTQQAGTALSSSCCCLEARLRQSPAPLLPKSSPQRLAPSPILPTSPEGQKHKDQALQTMENWDDGGQTYAVLH